MVSSIESIESLCFGIDIVSAPSIGQALVLFSFVAVVSVCYSGFSLFQSYLTDSCNRNLDLIMH